MQHNSLKIIAALLFISALSACASKQARPVSGAGNDRLEPFNRATFRFNEQLDRYFMKPIAKGYVRFTPKLYRAGTTNFFENVKYLNVMLNSFLQGKLKQGASDTTRFLINSTLGVGGLIDVATPMKFEKNEEDFGQTLAAWGVGQGDYLYLPFRGPNTVRNTPDIATGILTNPLTYLSSTIVWPFTVLDIVNTRANLLELSDLRDTAAIDPYIFTREAYLQKRNSLVHDGAPPLEDYEDIFDDFEDEVSDDGVLEIE